MRPVFILNSKTCYYCRPRQQTTTAALDDFTSFPLCLLLLLEIEHDSYMSVFKKIIEGELEADIVFEDDLCMAFRDINPQAPTHILVIPKKEIPSLAEADPDDHALMGHLLLKAAQVAREEGLEESGFRVVVNTGKEGGQAVDHLHLHVLGGRQMEWPPG